MKKVLVLALGMLLIPFTAFGMQAMTDSDLESITGQSGVAISLENVQVYTHQQGEEIWYETSGNAVGIVFDDDQSYSYIYVTTLDYTGGDLDTLSDLARGNYGPITGDELTPDGMPQEPRVLTIRVKDDTDGDRLFFDPADDISFVEIGLPTLEIVAEEGAQEIMSIYVVSETNPIDLDLANDPDSGDDWRIGRIHTTDGESTTAIFGGRVGITAYGNVHEDNVNPVSD